MEDQIKADLKIAMLAKDETSVGTLRMLISEIRNASISKGTPLEDTDIVTVVQKELKKRKEAAEGFRSGGREDSAQKEEAEAAVLEKYLPKQMADDELNDLIDQVISQTGAKSIQDMGKVIGAVRAKVGQSATGERISSMVKIKLSA